MPNEKLQPVGIYNMLPRTSCKQCGQPSCFAFAFALMARENKPEDCPGLFAEEYKPTLDMLSEYFGGEVEIEETGLIIDKALCTGCGNCVIACDKCNTIVEHTTRDFIPREVPSVLRVVDGRVTVAEWSSCKRCMDTPEWCRVCEQRCPSGALELVLK